MDSLTVHEILIYSHTQHAIYLIKATLDQAKYCLIKMACFGWTRCKNRVHKCNAKGVGKSKVNSSSYFFLSSFRSPSLFGLDITVLFPLCVTGSALSDVIVCRTYLLRQWCWALSSEKDCYSLFTEDVDS